MPDYTYEIHYTDEGYKHICGVDEAGRGPLSGPVVAAAVILPCGLYIEGLNDSKKLTEKKRDALFDIIKENALAYGIGSASPPEIDEYNILNATMLAMHRAIDNLPIKADFALVDGNVIRGYDIPAKAIVKGDSVSASIAAASILAKVTRDRICLEDAKKYPQYDFAKHKGYCTKEHMDLLRKYGPCEIHRRSFLKFLSEDKSEP
ncbi:MAG: ribonuclease HII [Eubacteriales bacterium]|nr:ribonuclease HII [Eubacteriales bacterium]